MTRLRDLAIDGLLLVLPVVVVLVLLGKAVAVVARLFAPMAHLLPEGRWFGIAALDIVATLALLLALIGVGAFARTAPGRRLSQQLEQIVLRKIPGFLLFKSVAAGFSTEERDVGLIPALITLDDTVVLGFIVEQASAADGMLTVFLPTAPTPAAGQVVLLPRERVQPLDVPVSHAMQTVSRLGLGLQELVEASAAAQQASVKKADRNQRASPPSDGGHNAV